MSTANLLVARNIPVTFTKPAAEIISELQESGPIPEVIANKKPEPVTKPTPARENEPPARKASKLTRKAVPKVWHEPEVRAARPVQKTIPRATLVSPGVQQFHTRPAAPLPVPARKGVPLQHFNMENDGHNG